MAQLSEIVPALLLKTTFASSAVTLLRSHRSRTHARVVAALTRAAILQAVRQAACRCLASFASLPAERAMPYQPTVTRGLKKALDDPKRRVRLAAADARNDWYLLGHGAGGPA